MDRRCEETVVQGIERHGFLGDLIQGTRIRGDVEDDCPRRRGRPPGVADSQDVEPAEKGRVDTDEIPLGRLRVVVVHALRGEGAGGQAARQTPERCDRERPRQQVRLVDHERRGVLERRTEHVGADVEGEPVHAEGRIIGEQAFVAPRRRREPEEREAGPIGDRRARADGDQHMVVGRRGVDHHDEPPARQAIVPDVGIAGVRAVADARKEDVRRHVQPAQDSGSAEDPDAPVGDGEDLCGTDVSHAIRRNEVRFGRGRPGHEGAEVHADRLGAQQLLRSQGRSIGWRPLRDSRSQGVQPALEVRLDLLVRLAQRRAAIRGRLGFAEHDLMDCLGDAGRARPGGAMDLALCPERQRHREQKRAEHDDEGAKRAEPPHSGRAREGAVALPAAPLNAARSDRAPDGRRDPSLDQAMSGDVLRQLGPVKSGDHAVTCGEIQTDPRLELRP